MPLTTEQTEDAVSLLSQRSKVSKKLLFIAVVRNVKNNCLILHLQQFLEPATATSFLTTC